MATRRMAESLLLKITSDKLSAVVDVQRGRSEFDAAAKQTGVDVAGGLVVENDQRPTNSMLNIRDHFVDVALYEAGSDRDELIGDGDDMEATEEEDEDDDDDDMDDDDDDNEIDDDEGDDDEYAEDADNETECDAARFPHCHSTTVLMPVDNAVDNELSSAPICPHVHRTRTTTGGCRCDCPPASSSLVSGELTWWQLYGLGYRPLQSLAANVAVLFGATLALLITFALYMEQLSATDAHFGRLAAHMNNGNGARRDRDQGQATDMVGGLMAMPQRLNGLGALVFVNGVVFYALCAAVLMACWLGKWWSQEGVKLLQFPLPANRLFYISNLAGAAAATIFICSYQRVACHLQDPLKGFCLAFAIVFYFLFCKKVMGLQKIFAATTAVVGLLIAVDYGLCDSFRCRGVDVPPGVAATGWQSRAVWTMGYIAALAGWTLQWLLLEGDVVTTFPHVRPAKPAAGGRLVSTISRLVAMSTSATAADQTAMKPSKYRRNLNPNTFAAADWHQSSPAAVKRKPKALVVAVWLHGLASLAALTTGLIDYIPGTPGVPTTSFATFLYDTSQTVMCHTNLCYLDRVPTAIYQLTLNESVSSSSSATAAAAAAPRPRRSLTDSDTPTKLHEVVINGTVHLHLDTGRPRHHSGINATTATTAATTTPSSPPSTRQQIPMPVPERPPTATPQQLALRRKIDAENWKKYREYEKRKRAAAASAQARIAAAQAANKHSRKEAAAEDTADADDDTDASIELELDTVVSSLTLNWPIIRTGLLFALVYGVFLVCSVQFLLVTESAVFGVAVMSLALPVAGVFWSLFELKTVHHIATIVWAPEVTGELICSVLGTPIIVLGLLLFAAAHLDDAEARRRTYIAVAS